MKGRLEKPVLLLPVRPLLVPCDYDPKDTGDVVWREYSFNVYYEHVATGQNLMGYPIYIKRRIEMKEVRRERTSHHSPD